MTERANISNSSPAAGPEAAHVPPAAAWLGGLGVVPFAGLALAALFADAALKPQLVFALLAYGATILSFLGGIHWGLAIGAVRRSDRGLWRRIAFSVLPSLIGWVALLVPSRIGLPVLAGAFAAMLAVDILAARIDVVPAWYPRLRWPLSCGAIAALLVATAA